MEGEQPVLLPFSSSSFPFFSFSFFSFFSPSFLSTSCFFFSSFLYFPFLSFLFCSPLRTNHIFHLIEFFFIFFSFSILVTHGFHVSPSHSFHLPIWHKGVMHLAMWNLPPTWHLIYGHDAMWHPRHLSPCHSSVSP